MTPVVCLQPGEEIGKEVHPSVDQCLRLEHKTKSEGEAAQAAEHHR